jgi:hypothetical protein
MKDTKNSVRKPPFHRHEMSNSSTKRKADVIFLSPKQKRSVSKQNDENEEPESIKKQRLSTFSTPQFTGPKISFSERLNSNSVYNQTPSYGNQLQEDLDLDSIIFSEIPDLPVTPLDNFKQHPSCSTTISKPYYPRDSLSFFNTPAGGSRFNFHQLNSMKLSFNSGLKNPFHQSSSTKSSANLLSELKNQNFDE